MRPWKKPWAGFARLAKEIGSSSGLRVHEAKPGQVSSSFDVSRTTGAEGGVLSLAPGADKQ